MANKESNIDLTSLRIFVETAKDCNMTRAAESLGVSQPAVSAAIKKIETTLGSPLFDRDRRPLQLTNAGRFLWNRAYLLLEQLDDLTRSVRDSIEGKRPDMRLGASDSLTFALVPRLLSRLLEITDNLTVKTGSTPLISTFLNQKKIDIGLSSDAMEDVEGTRSFHFLTERFLFLLPRCVTESHPVHCAKDLVQAVKGLPYLRFGKETFDFVQSERIYRTLHLMDVRRVEIDTNLSMTTLISQGKGWGILPPLSLWSARIDLDKIDFFPLNIEATRRYFVLCNDKAYDDLAKQIYRSVVDIFENEIFPDMKIVQPGLLPHIQLHRHKV